MKRSLLFALMLLFGVGKAHAQLQVPSFPNDPPTCNNNDGLQYFNTTLGIMKYCSALNTWGAIGTTPTSSAISGLTTKAIYAADPTYGGKFDGKYETDCTFNSTTTVVCPSGGFTSADVGKLAFGTSYKSTVTSAPSGTLACSATATSPTSIASVSNATTVLLANACAGTGSTCVGSVTQLCGFAWYTQTDDAAVTAAEAAAWTTPGNKCFTLVLPGVPIFLNSNHFGGAGGNNCNGDPDAAQWGPELMGLGLKSTVIIPTPDYNFTNCTNGGANGASGSSCFGGLGGLVAHDFSIYGMGQSMPTTTHAVNIFDFNGNTTFWNTSQCTGSTGRNMRLAQWGSQSTSMVGLNVEGSCDVDIWGITVEEAGETPCQFAPISDTTTVIGVTSLTCFGCLKICVNITGAGTWTSTGGYYGGLLANAANVFAMPGNTNIYINSFSDVIFGEEPFTNVFGFLVTNTAATRISLSGDRLSLNSGDGASSYMFDLAGGAGTQLILYANTITATGTNNAMFLTSAGNGVYDACGNTFQQGSVANTLTGGYFGSCSTTGTAITAAKLVLSGGWGSTAAWTVLTGATQYITGTITASGTGQGASPTITYTFPTPFVTTPTGCYASQVGGTQTAIANPFTPSSVSATGVTFTYNGTPGANNTLFVQIQCWNP